MPASSLRARPYPRGSGFKRISTYKEVPRPRVSDVGSGSSTIHIIHNSISFLRLLFHTTSRSTFTSTVVFLASEGQAPAFDSRFLLIMAGDVEENPGPRQSCQVTTCDGCLQSIREDHLVNALTCAEDSCSVRCHQTPDCCRIGRYRTKDHWKCRLHSPSPPPPLQSQPAASAPPKEKQPCAKKGCPTKWCKQNPFQCCSCQRYFHQRCTGIDNIHQDQSTMDLPCLRGRSEQGPSIHTRICGRYP